ncbi:fumarylacetoacetate hydrolase family protein [Pusillimonas sp.]|uniref:fumarylacetoacetate hydrolase family protein n=1 Tax=Pusillimonas sp. TaxID=3040095 RepID=UPI0029B1BFCE|nr:fumarylacetoacetate hydrolase family protein [Pusillimonas sp.]MDX3895457.1 fumarylacetoacetate hydrolase family protein [Pusillimonas sp.]
MTYKLLSYEAAHGTTAGILVDGKVYEAEKALGDARYRSMLGILENWGAIQPRLTSFAEHPSGDGVPVASLTLAAPIPRPPAIYCAGANYQDHVANMARVQNLELDADPHASGQKPWHFIKSSACVIATRTTVQANSKKLDWEAELALVVGVRARGLTLDNALTCIAAITNANDFSARDYLQREQQDFRSPFKYDWIGHKSFDGSCPLGPWLTPLDAVENIQDLPIRLWVNDVLRQDSTTGNMIFTAAEQLVQLSSRLTLYPGDVILTGTPAGTGAEVGEFLKSGDVVRIQIAGLGELVNTVE